MFTSENVRESYRSPAAVGRYSTQAIELGLWRSEEIVMRRIFRPEETLLDVGCGAGRVTLGLWELGYRRTLGVDFSPEMVAEARRLAARLEYEIPFRTADARELPFEDGLYDGAIFSFNGLMCLPLRAERRRALREVRRVLRPGGRGVFTTHDRENPESFVPFWREERERWGRGEHDPRLTEYGDQLFQKDGWESFIHIPDRAEVLEDLAATGWKREDDAMRSEISAEPPEIEEATVDCRFWIARRDG